MLSTQHYLWDFKAANIGMVLGKISASTKPFSPACLVGGFNTSEKYESQLGVLFPVYGSHTVKFMFQTTNQCIIPPGNIQITMENHHF